MTNWTQVIQQIAPGAKPVIVVTGHQREQVEAAVAGLDVKLVHNPDFANGLSTSVKAGLSAVPQDVDGAIVCLGAGSITYWAAGLEAALKEREAKR